MANIQTWNGTATFSAGMTPFGFYDDDAEFQTDIIKVAKFCGQRLGYPLMDVELQSGSFFACFEEAITTYGNEVFTYKVKALLLLSPLLASVDMTPGSSIPVREYLAGFFIGISTLAIPLLCVVLL